MVDYGRIWYTLVDPNLNKPNRCLLPQSCSDVLSYIISIIIIITSTIIIIIIIIITSTIIIIIIIIITNTIIITIITITIIIIIIGWTMHRILTPREAAEAARAAGRAHGVA